ncbi:AAA family ATPase [Bernardetia sp. ABR2-2B]|uniref:AAA family ATPase n=1 Tax=Bernardetia sp. ABR2-2B TaxID=3127472 RepID=UPI0030CC21EE
MQLLYLWIEDYKNIKQQGFNFSPLYDFHFEPTFDENDKEKKIVTGGTLIDKMKPTEKTTKEKFYKDFFKDETTKNTDYGISNVTAIVGENGAGKSSVLEFIRKLGTIYIEDVVELKCVILMEGKGKLYKAPTNIEVSNDIDLIDINNFSIVNYSYSLENFIKHGVDVHTKRANYIDISINNLFYNLKSFDENGKVSLSNYIDDENYLQFLYFLEFGKYFGFTGDELAISIYFEKSFQSDIIKELIVKEVQSNSLQENISENFYRSLYLKIMKSIESRYIHEILSMQKAKNRGNIFLDKLFYTIRNSKGNYEKLINDIKLLYDSQDAIIKYDFQILLIIEPSKKLLNILQQSKLQDNRFSIKTSSNLFFKFIDIDKKIPIKFYSLNFATNGSVIYLSYGEKALMKTFSLLHQVNEHIERIWSNIQSSIGSFTLLIDEGELGLHPQWQKQYLKILLETLPKIFLEKKIQLILTSHSPFLVSDLPKENVIFLEKEDNTGLCKVSKLESMKETFGANIHTLLTDSFFMKGGLVGEFAQSKIDEAIDILNESEPKQKELDKCEMIISMIGEPIVKNMLQKLLDSKRLRKVDEHTSEIKEMREELKELKKWKKLKEEQDKKNNNGTDL